MLRVFTEVLPDTAYIPLLYPNLGTQKRDTILFLNNAFADMREPFVELVSSPEQADYILLAHNVPSLKGRRDFMEKQAALARKTGKHLIVFWRGDSNAPLRIPEAIIFRTSLYRYTRRAQEIAMPAYAEDLLGKAPLTLREKSDRKPVVGFCGWAKYKNAKNVVGTLLQNGVIRLTASMGQRGVLAYRKGLSFRREAIAVLERSSAIDAQFIVRSSYSGNQKTIRMDADTARSEYRENLLGSDLALCIKGDGNYSYRFYEALSLGRIPLLLDTQCILPLEDNIDYDSFMLRVDYRDLEHLPDIVNAWWQKISPEEFIAMQKRAREAYQEYLSVKSFLKKTVEVLEAIRGDKKR